VVGQREAVLLLPYHGGGSTLGTSNSAVAAGIFCGEGFWRLWVGGALGRAPGAFCAGPGRFARGPHLLPAVARLRAWRVLAGPGGSCGRSLARVALKGDGWFRSLL
jgi:hypothetical protein